MGPLARCSNHQEIINKRPEQIYTSFDTRLEWPREGPLLELDLNKCRDSKRGHYSSHATSALFKGELQRENKLISYERAFKKLENDMYIAGIGQVVLELLSFKVESGNHQRGISLLQKFSDIFGNMRLVPLKMTSHLTSHNFQILKIEIFSKLCKI